MLGTDTEVGKTYQSVRLLQVLSDKRFGSESKVGVYKPVASGVSPDHPSDPELLAEAAGHRWPHDRICPQTFEAPLAPPFAARAEGKSVDEQLLTSGAQWWTTQCDFLVIEGAGGALSPISERQTVLDFAAQLHFPTIVVAANRLGCVNHSLLTVKVIQSRGLSVLGIVLNTIPMDAAQCDDRSLASNAELLREFLDPSIPIVHTIEDLVESL